VRISQADQNPARTALKHLTQGKYYTDRSKEVVAKAELAMDDYVGPAMNIRNDNGDRSMVHQGRELSVKLRKGDRYLGRAEVNQSAYNNALAKADQFLGQAVKQSADDEKAKLSQILQELRTLSADTRVEEQATGLRKAFSEEGRPRLEAVENDQPGRDVSEHGKPIWDLFETSLVVMEQTGRQLESEQQTLESLIGRLTAIS